MAHKLPNPIARMGPPLPTMPVTAPPQPPTPASGMAVADDSCCERAEELIEFRYQELRARQQMEAVMELMSQCQCNERR
jgi:hypothetical protein